MLCCIKKFDVVHRIHSRIDTGIYTTEKASYSLSLDFKWTYMFFPLKSITNS